MLLTSHMPEPRSPGQRIIKLLMRQGPMTISELVAALGVTTTAIRQQVNRLLAEGWLMRSQRRGGPGRPADVFAVAEEAKRLFGGQAEELSRLLLDEIERSDGPDKRRALLEAVGRRMAGSARPFVGQGHASDRFARLADLLSREGVLAEADRSGDELKLAVFTCPYHGVASGHREICEMEREAFSELLGDAVALDRCVLDGHPCCEFRAPAGREPPGSAGEQNG